MKKNYIIVVCALLILGSIALLGFNKASTLKEDVSLRNSIVEVVQKSNEIDFSQITNFEWNTMYIFTSYSSPKGILKEDGITTKNSRFRIEHLDDITMIGFIESNKLVAFVELPRNYGEVDLSTYVKFSKKEAKFNILQDKKTIVFKRI